MSEYRATEGVKSRIIRLGSAWSTDEEIFIESTVVQGQTIRAFFGEKGEVKTEIVNKTLNRIVDTTFIDTEAEKNFRKAMVRVIQIAYLLLAVYFCIKHHTFIPITGTIFFTFMALVTGAFMAVPVWIVQSFSYLLSRAHVNAMRHHAAEHKALNAYTIYERIPTMEEVKKTTRLAVSCGTNSYAKEGLTKLLGSAILTFIMLAISNAIFNLFSYFSFRNLLITVFIIILTRYLIRHSREFCEGVVDYGFENNILTFFQLPFLRKPNEDDLKLALEALKGYIDMENYIQEHIKDEYSIKGVMMPEESKIVTIEYKNGIKAECTLDEIMEEMDEFYIVVVYPKKDTESDAPKNE